MTEKRKYRVFSPEQKLAIVIAGMRGDRPVKDVCRDHQISDALSYSGAISCWRRPRSASPAPDAGRHPPLRLTRQPHRPLLWAPGEYWPICAGRKVTQVARGWERPAGS